MRGSRIAVMLLSACASRATAQPRHMSAIPVSRKTSVLTSADSIALVEAGARAALGLRDGAPSCIVAVDDSLGGPAGAAFRREARRTIAAMATAHDSASVLSFVLLGVRDGDTATVVLRIAGTGPPATLTFWVNELDYYFVRSDTAPGWRYVDHRLRMAADYVAEHGPVRLPTCLNGRRK